jgi:hypothetical protein
MASRICPYCREKIQRQALVCRCCKRDLPELPPVRGRGHWLPVLVFTAALVAGGAVVVAEFFRERRNWLD